MLRRANVIGVFLISITVCYMVCCKNRHVAPEKEIVQKPEEMDDQIRDNIKVLLEFAKDNKGKLNDSVKLFLFEIKQSPAIICRAF